MRYYSEVYEGGCVCVEPPASVSNWKLLVSMWVEIGEVSGKQLAFLRTSQRADEVAKASFNSVPKMKSLAQTLDSCNRNPPVSACTKQKNENINTAVFNVKNYLEKFGNKKM